MDPETMRNRSAGLVSYLAWSSRMRTSAGVSEQTRSSSVSSSIAASTSAVSTARPRSVLRGLLLLNAVLLIVLALVTFGSAVKAQPAPRSRGEYTMVAGGGSGTDASIIWIADVANQELIAMTYDHNNRVLDGVGYRNLAADAASVVRGRPRPSN